ncbi:syntaxin [Trypanosoma grayi]|uniref:syntaxin n=1 Tax=Trypanosoma grayi TaxID=71804 RepID=UPI0004F48F95|nr:syntaxin [Trypanosoma grayi]KEG13251.1 syntaxin [Trypanosoma grayi]
MSSISHTMKRLQNVNGASGCSTAASAPQLPLHEGEEMQLRSKMTPYEECQLRVADRMRRIRELVTQLDALPTRASRTDRVELCQQIRREERQVKVDVQDARKLALSESRQREFEILSHHFKGTLELVRNRYGGGLPLAEAGDTAAGGASSVFADLDNAVSQSGALAAEADKMVPGPEHSYNIHNDVEFTQFFLNTHKNDMVIDEALDRIYSGVQRVNDNATQITFELRMQEQKLDGSEKKMNTVHSKLGRLNARLKKAIKDVGRSMLIVYFLCCLILLIIIVVIYVMAKR